MQLPIARKIELKKSKQTGSLGIGIIDSDSKGLVVKIWPRSGEQHEEPKKCRPLEQMQKKTTA